MERESIKYDPLHTVVNTNAGIYYASYIAYNLVGAFCRSARAALHQLPRSPNRSISRLMRARPPIQL
jgi:hypothetical protein